MYMSREGAWITSRTAGRSYEWPVTNDTVCHYNRVDCSRSLQIPMHLYYSTEQENSIDTPKHGFLCPSNQTMSDRPHKPHDHRGKRFSHQSCSVVTCNEPKVCSVPLQGVKQPSPACRPWLTETRMWYWLYHACEKVCENPQWNNYASTWQTLPGRFILLILWYCYTLLIASVCILVIFY